MLAPGVRIVGEAADDFGVSIVNQTASLLFADTSQRPSPRVVAEHVDAGLDEETIKVAGKLYGLTAPIMTETLDDLDASLPYFHMAVDKLTDDFPHATFLFAGRDAEVFYDDFAIANDGHPGHLLPASNPIWRSNGMKNDDLADQFLSGFDLSGLQVTDPNNKYVLVDSGFYGSIGTHLADKLMRLHGVSVLATGQMAVKLMGIWDERVRERQIMCFDDCLGFPELNRPKRATKIIRDRAGMLAVAMQLMPRYHGPFIGLSTIDGGVRADCRDEQYANDVDAEAVNLNSSVVNPVAAAITQFRVVRSAMQRKGQQ